MLWYLLAAVIALGSLVLLGLVLLSAWRVVKALSAAVGRAGNAVAGVQGELEAGLAELQARAPSSPDDRSGASQGADGAALARRVQATRR